MSLSVIPLVILGQITEASINVDADLYQMTFKDTNGVPLYGVTAVWTDEQAEIEALAAQKPYGVWINPIDGTFTIKFAGYTYTGTADLSEPDVLNGITLIVFNNEAAGGDSGELSACTMSVTSDSVAWSNVLIPEYSEGAVKATFFGTTTPDGVIPGTNYTLIKGIDGGIIFVLYRDIPPSIILTGNATQETLTDLRMVQITYTGDFTIKFEASAG